MKVKASPRTIPCKLEGEYDFYIRDFIKTMKRNYNSEYLYNFYENIKTLKLIPRTNEAFNISNASAEYDIFNNVIMYSEATFKRDIMHELLHVSSTIPSDDRVYTGFLQVLNNGFGRGIGLNEGYTSLLDDRYFINYDKEKMLTSYTTYPTVKYISQVLEYILGQDTLEELYFHADLKELMKTLAFYTSKEDAENFITDVDNLFFMLEIEESMDFISIFELYEDITKFLGLLSIIKFKYMRIKEEISIKEYQKALIFSKHVLNSNIRAFKILRSKKYGKHIDEFEDLANEYLKRKN